MRYALKNLGLQIGNVAGRDEVNEVIRVRFTRVIPGPCRDSAGGVAGDEIWDTQDHEFHQRPTSWRATGIYGGIIPTHDHRRRRQCASATLQIDPRKKVERRFAKVNMRGLARRRSRFVVNWTLEGNEHDKNRIAPFVALHFIDDCSSHHSGTEQIDYEMTGIDIRDDQLTGWNLFAACQAHGSGTFCIAQNFLDEDACTERFMRMRHVLASSSE